jgi:hypothetical protein
VDFVDVNPKTIRFFFDETKGTLHALAEGDGGQRAKPRRNGQRRGQRLRRTQRVTFHYYAFDAAPQSPYGTPPFLAALGGIAIQQDMVANMSQIVKKIGLLGIIDVIVKQLPPAGGDPEEYQARAETTWTLRRGSVQDMVRDGGIVHFDDVETQAYVNMAGNAAGATNIFKQNEELVFSGLKSMPSVQGRSYSTTETYAGVAYDIIIRNTKKYQRACKRMIESGYWLIATLAGLATRRASVDLQREQDAAPAAGCSGREHGDQERPDAVGVRDHRPGGDGPASWSQQPGQAHGRPARVCYHRQRCQSGDEQHRWRPR